MTPSRRAITTAVAVALTGSSALTVQSGVAAAAPVPAVAEHGHTHGHVADEYTLELLEPTSDGVTASALGLNDTGDVVGITRPTASAQPQMTVLWEHHGDHFHAHELENLEGSKFSRGFDLNDDQAIVGEAFNSAGRSIPVRWTGESPPQHVTNLDGAGSGILNDVDDSGTAVGTASGHGVRVAGDGSVTVLADPATGIEGATVKQHAASSVAGDVIGGRATIAVPHDDHTHDELRGVVWEDGVGRLLNTPEGGSSPVVAEVTSEGEAFGSVRVGSTESAVAWSPDGAPELLSLPGVADYPHTSAKAAADDVVVGMTTKFAGNPSFGGAAVAWDDHGPVDLNTRVVDAPEGVLLQSANDINEAGQIVGNATTAAGARGFVLTPVAEGSEPQPLATTVRAGAVRQIWGRAARLPVTVTAAEPGHPVTGTVTARIGGKVRAATVRDGRASLAVPARTYAPGVRSITIDYTGVPGQFEPAHGSARLRVDKARSTARVVKSKKTVKRGRIATFRVNVAARGVVPTGRVVVRIPRVSKTAALVRGRAVVKLRIPHKARPGVRRVVVNYLGNRYVAADRAVTRVRVIR